MRRAFLIAVLLVASPLLLGAAPRSATVEYRLGVTATAAGQPPVLDIEVRLRGDADGETRLDLPDSYGDGVEFWKQVHSLKVSGAQVSEDGPAHRVLRHRPGAKITLRYRVSTGYAADPQGQDGNPYRGAIIRPDWLAVLGETAFVVPGGRGADPAVFRWGKLPRGWRAASDLEAPGLTVGAMAESVTLASPRLQLVERPLAGGGALKVVSFEGSPFKPDALADEISRTVSGQRAFWNDTTGPYFVGLIPLTPKTRGSSVGGTGRGPDGFVLYATPNVAERAGSLVGHEHMHGWIPARLGTNPGGEPAEAGRFWLSEGFTDFLADRVALRAGIEPADAVVSRMAAAMKAYDASPVKTAANSRIVTDFWKDPAVQKLPYQRGALLALKWDEEIRRKSRGARDFDDVLLQMRDHAARFPPGQAPDIVTGLVSAAWVVAQVDLRADIARHAERGEAIVLPDEMFDGCLQAAVTVAPGFDSGFDHVASATAKVARGVRRRGPAWNSGLRDGMRLDVMDLKAGDMNREIVLTVRPANGRGRARTLRYWPYGDVDVQTRVLRLTPGLSEAQRTACARKIGGL